MNLGLWGRQISNAIEFAESGLDNSREFECAVTGERVTGAVLFPGTSKRRYMRPASIPGDLALKAIAVEMKYLFLEMAPPNVNDLKAIIIREMLPLQYRAKEGRVIDATTRMTLAYHSRSEVPTHDGVQLLQRVLWVSTIGEERRRTEMFVRLLDLMQKEDAFLDRALVMPRRLPPLPPPKSPEPPRGPRLTLELQQRQVITIEQRPKLALEQRPELGTKMRMTTELQLRQMFVLEQRALRMTPDEIIQMILDNPTIAGHRMVERLLFLGVTRAVKNAQPSLSWREVRALVRRVLNKRSVSYPDQFMMTN